MTHDEMIAVIQAHKDGKAIEGRSKDCLGKWCEMKEPGWSFRTCEYRVKREPRVLHITECSDGALVGVKFVEVME